ncbi:MAG: hypothetical protein GW849_02335 [Flavobacteriia bacterium]|nr:hypothetical protein [Flavobacteriia bacterium]NCT18026.1 hypothetical protein [Flavobacteriia bacterium]
MDRLSEKYIKGFNQAFLLKEHNPDLIDGLLITTSNNEYIQGLKDGAQIYDQKKTKSRTQNLKNLTKQRDNDQDLEL